MIRDEAEKLCERLVERFGAEGLTATVAASDERIEFAAPGGGRPHIIRYKIRIAAGEREALVEMDDAEELLESPADWDVNALFAEISGRGL